MTNPVFQARKEKCLTIKQLAFLAGVSETRVRQIERGDSARLTGALLDTLEQLGYDRKEIAKKYEAWRMEQTRKILQEIENAGA